MKEIVQISKQQEFSTSLIRDIWGLFVLKQWKPDLHITCYNPLKLPEKLTKQFANQFISYENRPKEKVDQGWKYLLHNLDNIPKEIFHRRIDLSFLSSPLSDPYVCLIPNISDRYCSSRMAVGFSFPQALWYRLADQIRAKGFKVVITGVLKPTCLYKMDLKKFADVPFVKRGNDDNYFIEELKYLAGAKAIVGFAGGAHFAPVFGLPGVSSCWRFYDVDYCWPKKSKIGERFNLRVKYKGYYESDEQSREEGFERFYDWVTTSLWDLLGVK